MSPLARVTLVVLVFDAFALAAVELFYLPLRVGTVPFPITILLAAVSTPWLVRSAAELGGPRVVAAVPLVVWVLVIGVLGVGGPGVGGSGGDVLLAADWRSVLLLAGGMVPAAVALGRVLARPAVAGSLVDTRPGGDIVQADGPFGYRE
ncbi:MAG: hypothetical protein ACRDRS_22740 [Pseudonocardiaceae bacterium]